MNEQKATPEGNWQAMAAAVHFTICPPRGVAFCFHHLTFLHANERKYLYLLIHRRQVWPASARELSSEHSRSDREPGTHCSGSGEASAPKSLPAPRLARSSKEPEPEPAGEGAWREAGSQDQAVCSDWAGPGRGIGGNQAGQAEGSKRGGRIR